MSLWEASQLPSPQLPLQFQGPSRYLLELRDECCVLRLSKLDSRHLHYSNEPPPSDEKTKTGYRRKAFSHLQWCGCRCICFKMWLSLNRQMWACWSSPAHQLQNLLCLPLKRPCYPLGHCLSVEEYLVNVLIICARRYYRGRRIWLLPSKSFP